MAAAPPAWWPPWEAGLGALAGLALLSSGVIFHLGFAPGSPTLDTLLEQPLAWTLVAATPLLAALGWVIGDRRRERVQALQAWQASTERGMRDLAQREWLTRGILQTAFDAVLVIDDDEVVVDANPAAVRIFGWPLDNLVGATVSQVLPEHRRLGTTLAIERRTAGGEVLGREWQTRARHRNGHRFPVDLNMVALREPNLLLYVVREATTRVEAEAKRVADARAELIDRSTAARRERSGQLLQLSAQLSADAHALLSTLHDEGAPLDAPPPGRAARDHALSIAVGIERLQSLSLWERGSRVTTQSIVPLPALVHQVADLLRPLADARDLRLAVTVADDVGEVETDALRLSAALRALMAHAIAASTHGEVGVQVLREPGRRADWLALYVSDTGPGLDDDALDAMFAMLATDASELGAPPAEGLGVSLAHHLSSALGGHLSVASVDGEGCTYTLRIPASGPGERDLVTPPPIRLDSDP